ncbi:hypothetical protein [Anaerosolibacter sp.]|uniref:hypothetical protein n=1 Tax=Anaerosolibacter sp. TaxID=1872527 RepID=UPI0039F10ADD
MFVNIVKLENLLNNRNWSTYKLSKLLGLDYSYVHRVMKKEATPGSKFINSLIKMCQENNLDVNEYIFLGNALHINNVELRQ